MKKRVVRTPLKRMSIATLRPNNWYLSASKLNRITRAWREGTEGKLPPVLVTEIDGTPSLIDGHCRAFVAQQQGKRSILATTKSLKVIGGPTGVYEYLHREGERKGILTIADLETRVLTAREYKRLWVSLCRSLEDSLDKARRVR